MRDQELQARVLGLVIAEAQSDPARRESASGRYIKARANVDFRKSDFCSKLTKNTDVEHNKYCGFSSICSQVALFIGLSTFDLTWCALTAGTTDPAEVLRVPSKRAGLDW